MAINLALASLFSGAGGLDIGFLEKGFFSSIYACDTDIHARATYEKNLDHSPSASCVTSLKVSELKGVDIILAGPPCQGFSSIGRRNAEDSRNSLIIKAAELVAQARPALFVIENVRGLRWMGGGSYLDLLHRILQQSQLNVESIDIDCSSLGLAQRRRRILIVGGIGLRGERFIAGVRRLSSTTTLPLRTVKEVLLPVPALGSLVNHGPVPPHPHWYADVIKMIGPGQKLCDTRLGNASVHSWNVPGVFGKVTNREEYFLKSLVRLRRSEKNRPYEHIGDGRPVRLCDLAASLDLSLDETRDIARSLILKGFVYEASDAEVDLCRRFNGRFKRLNPEGVAPAVLKEFSSPRNILHPTEPRGLTVRECARLQGFEDSFEFVGPLRKQYQIVANAFPPSISRQLAGAALASLSK